jgi:hypothetical protein
MSRKTHLLIAAAAFSLTSAGAAIAQPLDLRLSAPDAAQAISSLPVRAPSGQPARLAPDLADPLDPLAPTVVQAKTLDGEVFAKTAVEHRFAQRDDLSGSFGFLCGRQPGHDASGVAAAYGDDPHGRFVGAKFAITF